MTPSTTNDSAAADTALIEKTLERTHAPVIRLTTPLPGTASAAKIESLIHERRDLDGFVASPTALQAHVKDVIAHLDVHAPHDHLPKEDADRLAEFQKDLQETVAQH